MSLEVEPLTGDAASAVLDEVARLRIEVFREYPYLYDGDLDYERKYLESLAGARDAVIVQAREGGTLIGASTGAPLVTQQESFRAPLRARGIPEDEVFYFGESVLLQKFRGRGLGHAFFDERENHARSLEEIRHCAFCAVVRPDDHPARPAQYRSHDKFWKKRGYEPLPGVVGSFPWQEVGAAGEVEHPMQFWMRSL